MAKVRIIPTGVGKTDPRSSHLTARPDHPHGCGENALAVVRCLETVGSSPRVWGKLALDAAGPGYIRIIPTGVGKTGHADERVAGQTDHPHGCGENAFVLRSCCRSSGSSPRVWGKRIPAAPG